MCSEANYTCESLLQSEKPENMGSSIIIENRTYKFDNKSFTDISIPIRFNGAQPNAYGVDQASARPCEAGQLVGDTRQGGSCNFEEYTLIPHCNGTHTECVGHITNERISILDSLKDVFIPAMVISVEPEESIDTEDSYPVEISQSDRLITRKLVKDGLAKTETTDTSNKRLDALIVRTIPNDDDKLSRNYGDYIPPFFSSEAMNLVVESGVRHILVDLPSIDRIFDEGKLSNHRTFWNIEDGSFETNDNTRVNSTITELIYVPNEINDGHYLLNLQIAAFDSDASPSRPILFALKD